ALVRNAVLLARKQQARQPARGLSAAPWRADATTHRAWQSLARADDRAGGILATPREGIAQDRAGLRRAGQIGRAHAALGPGVTWKCSTLSHGACRPI